MTRETLFDRYAKAKDRFDDIERKMRTRIRGDPCGEHEILCLQSVLGGLGLNIPERYASEESLKDGYQVNRCLVCEKVFLYTYHAKYVGPLTAEEATALGATLQ